MATFTVSLSQASTQTVSVDVISADGTATAAADYVAIPLTTLTFNPSEISKTVDVNLIDDALPEGDETFTLTLSNVVNGVLGTAVGTGTIADNEASPCGEPTYDTATEQAVFVWKDCTNGSWQARMTAGGVFVAYDGSVIADQAFTSVTGFSLETGDPTQIAYALTMAASGQDGFDFSFPSNANVCFGVDTPDGIPVYVGAARTPVTAPFDLATLGACSNLPTTIDINDISVAEDDAGGVAAFTVSLSQVSSQTISVDVASSDGSATAPADYTAVPLTTLTFNPGETSKTVNVSLVDDALAEGDETFTLTLSNAVNGVLGTATGTATITDDEASPCGAPTYDSSTEQAVFVWKDCGTDNWYARISAGGAPWGPYTGTVVADQAFTSVTGFSIEASDILDYTTDPTQVSYTLNVGGAGQDGFDFSFPANANVCFSLDSPSGVPVYVGASRTPVTSSFDLATLGVCSN